MRNQSLKNQPMSDLFSELANAGRPLFPGSDVDDQVLVAPETKFDTLHLSFLIRTCRSFYLFFASVPCKTIEQRKNLAVHQTYVHRQKLLQDNGKN